MGTNKQIIDECRDYVKPFYYPEEVAYSWCGFTEQEYKEIVDSIPTETKEVGFSGSIEIPISKYMFNDRSGYGQFPILSEYPCFKKRIEQITYAIEINQIPHSRDGVPINEGGHVKRDRRTVLPKDLKVWFSENHQNEKPAFIFNQLERKELLNAEKLLHENDDLKHKIYELESLLKKGRSEWSKLNEKNKQLQTGNKQASPKTENTMKSVIRELSALALNNGLSEHPFSDAEKILKKLATKNIAPPCSKETLADYLKS